MQKQLRTVLLTSNGLRHRYLAREIARSTNLVGVVCEGKSPAVAAPELLSAEDQSVIDRHFQERKASEERLLGKNIALPDTEILEIANGTLNTPEVFEWVWSKEPDFVLLYGSSIVKAPLLDTYDGRIVNMHLGLSPYYRGSGTNFWPLVKEQPECVGATIHLAVLSVDAGAILTQVRPEPEAKDRAHDLGTKTIMAGASAFARALELYAAGKIEAQPQNLAIGQVFRRKDFNADAVRQMWSNFDSGMMERYISQLEERRANFPIIEMPDTQTPRHAAAQEYSV